MDLLLDILSLLDNDMRKDVFIGFTGLLVAIVVFIAEIISNQNNELSKRVMLNKTDIVKNVIFIIFIYVLMWFGSLFVLSEDSSLLYKTVYYIIQLALNICIFISMYRTIIMFVSSIKINSNSEYFGEELDKYIKTRIYKNSLNERKRYSNKLKKQKEEASHFFNESKIFSDYNLIGMVDDDFEPVSSPVDGYIVNFDYSFLNKIESKIAGMKLKNQYYEVKSQDRALVIFSKNIGEKVSKNLPIAYCNKKYMEILKDIGKALILDKSHIFSDDELNLITNNLFKLSKSDDDQYDSNNRLLNYLDFLYKNNYISAKKIFLDRIEDEYRFTIKNKRNETFSRWLVLLSHFAYSNDNLEDYSYINNLVTYLYYFQIKDDNSDVKKISYNYANNFLALNFYSVKRKNDYRYYDNLMSNLFSYICDLIKSDRYDAVFVLFDNIYFDPANYWDELSDFDNVNFQFSIGIIYCLILKYQQVKIENISDEQKKEVKKLIDIIRDYFVGFYDCWSLVYNFKKVFNTISNIHEKYDHLESNFVDHEYINHWSGWNTGERTILKSMLYVLNIDDGVLKDEDLDLITKEDKYYYEDLLKLINEGFNNTLERIAQNSFDTEKFNEMFDKVIKNAKEKEKNYIKTAKLNKKKIENFSKILKETASGENELIKYVKEQGKTEMLNEEIKKVFGINQLIPRELFLDTMAGYEAIAKDYGNAFTRGITDEYIKKIESFSDISEKPIEDILKELSDPTKFLMLSDYLSYHYIKVDNKFENHILIDGKKLDVLKVPKINGIILIDKKELPKIQYCLFDEKFSKSNIENNIFYEIIDCSEDETIRKEILENSNWIKEKGDLLAQEEFLKQECRVRVYMAFKIVKIKNSKAIKINKKNDEED